MPTTFQPIHECRAIDAGVVRPLAERFRLTVDGDRSRCAPIQRLFLDGRPSHIAGLIVAVIVDPVDLMARAWARRHVVAERFKRSRPFVANLDAAPAVVGPLAPSRVAAASDDATPDSIERRAGHAVCRLPSLVVGYEALGPDAPARPGIPSSEIGSGHNFDAPALANALPHRHVSAAWLTGHDCQSLKNTASQIVEFGHAPHFISITH